MPGSFLGELAALAGFGPLDLGVASAVAPNSTLPAIPVSDPLPKDRVALSPPTQLPLSFPIPSPTQTTTAPTTNDLLPVDLTPINIGFGPQVAYNPPAVAVETPKTKGTETPSVTPGTTSAQPKSPAVTVDGPKSDPVTPGKSPKGGFGSYAESNQPPVANNDSYSTVHSRQLYIPNDGVLDNDYSSEGNALYTVLVDDVSHGVLEDVGSDLSFMLNGGFRYTPEPEFVGTDSFTYYVTDGQYNSSTVTVTIHVTNAAPTATSDSYTTTEDGLLEVTAASGGGGPGEPSPSGGGAGVLLNDADGDADVLYPLLITDTQHGGLDLRPDGSFTYAPNPNFSGTDSFTYKASDGIADSQPVTVTITVGPRQGPDLDGKDPSTDGQWMWESDELNYGVVVTAGSASVMAREPVSPGAGWQLTHRWLLWDPDALVVGGNTSGGLDLPLSGDQVRSLSALYPTTFTGSKVTYQETWVDPAEGLGQISMIWIQAAPQTAKIDSVDFTTDHNVLLKNGGLEEVGKDATRYPSTEWILAFGKPPQSVNSPFTHSRDKKIQATVKWSSAGIPANTPYRLEGTVGNTFGFPSQAMKFVGNAVTTGDSQTTNVITDVPLSKAMGIWTFSITWKVILNPGTAQEGTLDGVGTSGEHKVYQTYADPRGTGGGAGRPTVPRMSLATAMYTSVYIQAGMLTGSDDPKPARLVYHLLKRHVFNIKNSIVHVTVNQVDENRAWLVPQYWTTPFPKPGIPANQHEPGSNCISGALFLQKASYMVGIPGTIDVKQYAASMADASVATEISTWKEATAGTRAKNKNTPDKMEVALHFAGDTNNVFEATVLYTPPGQGASTLYIPSGITGDLLYDNKNKVLTVFSSFEWAVNVGGTWVKKTPRDIIKEYQSEASLPLSTLDQ